MKLKIARWVAGVLAVINLLPTLAFAFFAIDRTEPPPHPSIKFASYYYWPNKHILLGFLVLELAFILFLVLSKALTKRRTP